MGPRGLQELSCRILSLFLAPFWAHLEPILGHLGPSLAPLVGSRRASRGRFWAWKACFGGARWPKGGMPKTLKNLRKINVFGRFLEATSLQKACKVAVWRSCCGLEGLKRATWMPYWLQTWIKKASLSFRSTKLGSGSLHVGSNLRSDGLDNWKIAKTIVKTMVF